MLKLTGNRKKADTSNQKLVNLSINKEPYASDWYMGTLNSIQNLVKRAITARTSGTCCFLDTKLDLRSHTHIHIAHHTSKNIVIFLSDDIWYYVLVAPASLLLHTIKAGY